MYFYSIAFLEYFGCSCTDSSDFLRLLIIANHIRMDCPTFSKDEIRNRLYDEDIQTILHFHQFDTVKEWEEESLCESISIIFKSPDCKSTTLRFLLNAFPHILKSRALFDLVDFSRSDFCTLMRFLLIACQWYGDEGLTNGKYFNDQAFLAHQKLWNLLDIQNADTFLKAWMSVYCFACEEETMYIPKILKETISIYAKNKFPSSVLLTHFTEMTRIIHDQVQNAPISEPFNPWTAFRKSKSLALPEHGMTQEEILFNNSIHELVQCGVQATDIINCLFYKKRNDSLVEKNILFPALEIESFNFTRVLVVNPSPDFLVTYSKSPWTKNKETTFVVTDHTVANAYAAQFIKNKSYDFISFEDLSTPCDGAEDTPQKYDYIIVMARDSKLVSFKNVFRWCDEKAHLFLFLPQTMMTSKTEENIIPELERNLIYVDSILELPNALSESGKHKKMILRASKDTKAPRYFALIPSRYHVSKETEKITHYVIPDRTARILPYDLLHKNLTIKKMLSAADASPLLDDREELEGVKKRAYAGTATNNAENAKTLPFSQEIDITLNLYRKSDGRYRVRAYRQYVSDQYGHSERRKRSNRQSNIAPPQHLVRTPYYETSSRSLEELYRRITEWVLRPDITNLIARDLMAHFASQPADLTLKSVWYCTREELKVTYMRYNDALAIQLFSNKNRTLSDLKLCDATEERIMEALQLVVPESEADPQYKRLLDFIFRVAVKRGFLKSNPFKPTKTSLDHDRKKAMRQLRDALTKEALEDDQLFKILKFLLEPIGKTNTPRAVKKSIWLVPLIRMCTGMPLREICALRWKDFQQIDDLDAYQFRVTHLLNDFGEVVPMTTYQYAKQYRRVPCVTLLTHVLLQRQKYLQDNYRFFSHEAQEQPIIYFEEPNTPHVGRKKATMYCSIPQARKVSVQALQKANIPSKVIPLLDGEASFVEDLNATRNDLFYANFIHQANWFCGLSESELCYIIGRCAPSCYGGHYVDFENDFMQLDMIQRLDRLWYKVCQAWQKAAEYHHTTIESGESHTYVALPSAGQFASADLHIAHVAGSDTGEIFIRIESDHGADVKISAFP